MSQQNSTCHFTYFVIFLGYVWSKEKNSNPNWEVEVVFRISGRGRIGADGLVSDSLNNT